jgi:hypothetical protein
VSSKKKPPKKRGRRGPPSDADTIAALEALDLDWARAAKTALVRLSRYIIAKVDSGELDPLVAVGAFRTLSSAINDREAVIDPPLVAKESS